MRRPAGADSARDAQQQHAHPCPEAAQAGEMADGAGVGVQGIPRPHGVIVGAVVGAGVAVTTDADCWQLTCAFAQSAWSQSMPSPPSVTTRRSSCLPVTFTLGCCTAD